MYTLFAPMVNEENIQSVEREGGKKKKGNRVKK